MITSVVGNVANQTPNGEISVTIVESIFRGDLLTKDFTVILYPNEAELEELKKLCTKWGKAPIIVKGKKPIKFER